MSIDSVIINRILPDDVTDDYFGHWRKSQARYIKRAWEYFSPIPIFPVHLSKGEVLGYDRLRDLGAQLYGDRNPLERFFKGEPYELVKVDGEYRLLLKLPFVSKGDVEINKVSDELIIRLGSFKRNLLLPRQVAASKSVKARLEGETLCICFKGDGHER